MKKETSDHKLTVVEGFSFEVLSSSGSVATTKKIATRCQNALDYLAGILNFRPEIQLLVLDQEDWPHHAKSSTYGMPHFWQRSIIVSHTPGDFFHSFVELVENEAPNKLNLLTETYATSNGTIDLSLFSDLLVVHELGHEFHLQYPFHFPRLWLRELFCNYCLHVYVVEYEPEKLPILLTLPGIVTAISSISFQYNTWQDFEERTWGMSPDNYSWYQFHLHMAVNRAFESSGLAPLERLWSRFAIADQDLARILKEQVNEQLSTIPLS